MPRRKDGIDHDSLREKLVAVAEALVDQRGRESLTARALAEHIGYSVGHVYNLVADLDTLIFIVNSRTLDRMLEHLKQAVKGRKGAARFHALAAAYMEFCSDNARLWGLVLDHRLPEEHPLAEEHAVQIDALPALLSHELQSLFPERPSEQVAQDGILLWSSLHGLGALDSSGRLTIVEESDAQDLARLLMDLCLDGIRSQHI